MISASALDRHRWTPAALLALSLWLPSPVPAALETGGHVKVRGEITEFPDNSLIHAFTGDDAQDLNADLRFLLKGNRNAIDFEADAQVLVLYGDTVAYTRELLQTAPLFEQLFGRLPTDDRRWWDLTYVAEDEGKRAAVARLDRLSLGYTGDQLSVKFGRQAITWGNGLVYTPMDIVNPFDPTQVDTEYKPGDDMLYGQWLRENGDDVQATYVVRRDPVTGNTDTDQATAALKYHFFRGESESDVLLARHYGETLFAIGGSRDLGGAVWRGDLVLSDTETEGVVLQGVANTSYSWIGFGKNMTGSLEYYYNGFGQDDGCYSPECLADNPELVRRVARRQLYTLGRHYVGGSVLVEVTPLFTVAPNIFWNVSDQSALFQVVTENSLGDNLVLLGALGVPLGEDGTEFGGIESDAPGTYLSNRFNFFLQLSAYF